MKLERLEVRLRPKNSAEMELIEALEAQDGNYGGKNELMRECLRRGFTALKQKMESLSGEGDEIAALDALAQAFASGDYGYRVVKTYLNSRNQHSPAILPIQKSALKADSGEATPSTTSVVALIRPEPTQEEPSAAVDTLVAVPFAKATGAAFEPGVLLSIDLTPSGVVTDPPKRKVDWTKMRGLAGTGGDKIVEGEGGDK